MQEPAPPNARIPEGHGADHHHHDHGHAHRWQAPKRVLFLALLLTTAFMVVEIAAGLLTGSLALLADAGHMLADAGALGLALVAQHWASKARTERSTFGFRRAEVLAAFVNGVVLVLLSVWVIVEAVGRWQQPPDVKAPEMIGIAVGGLVVNIIAAILLHSGSKHDLNMRGAWLHVMGDMLGSVAAIIAGAAILFFGALWADPVCSVIISLVIIAGAWRLVSDSVNVLLEGTPRHIDVAEVARTILDVEGVAAMHDLHVWTISSGIDALSVHINHRSDVDHSGVMASVRDELHSRFGIDHLTIQMETMANESEAVYICETGTKCFVSVADGQGTA